MVQDNVAWVEIAEGEGLEKVQYFIRAYVKVVTTPLGMCLKRVDDHALSQAACLTVRGYKRDVDDLARRLILSGIRDGSIVSDDMRTVAFLVLGAMNRIGCCFHSEGPETTAPIAERFVKILTSGLRGEPNGELASVGETS